MPPAAQANLYATEADVRALLSDLAVDARLDDDESGAPEAGEAAFIAAALNYATARVKMYTAMHYSDADLARSWIVNYWATVIAAHWLSTRRCQSADDGLRGLMYGGGTPEDRGVMGDLLDVRAKRAQVGDIGYRSVDWPAWSNLTNDARYRLRQVRVQRPISEPTATQYPQTYDDLTWGAYER